MDANDLQYWKGKRIAEMSEPELRTALRDMWRTYCQNCWDLQKAQAEIDKLKGKGMKRAA